MNAKIKNLVLEYGKTALILHFSIFGLSLVGFVVAIKLGYTPKSVSSEAGIWGAAYLATQVIKPIRVGLTLVLTPLVAKFLRRIFPVSSYHETE